MNAATSMMEAGSSVLTLIALSADIVKALHALCRRFAQARARLNGLVLQMLALRTALHRIQDLSGAEVAQRGTSLKFDFDMCLSFCEVLLERLEQDLAKLNTDAALQEPAFLIRLKTAFNDGSATAMEALLDRQTNSLCLLLTSYSCQTLQQQIEMLQGSSSPAVPVKPSSDAASLCGLLDTESIFSGSTDLLSNISHEFCFDTALLSTKPYEKQSSALMHLLRQRVQRDSPRFLALPDREQSRPKRQRLLPSSQELHGPEKKTDGAVQESFVGSKEQRAPALCSLYTLLTSTSATALTVAVGAEKRRYKGPDNPLLWQKHGVYMRTHRTPVEVTGALLIANSMLASAVFDGHEGHLVIYLMDLEHQKKTFQEWQRQRCAYSTAANSGSRRFPRYFFSVVLADDESMALAEKLRHARYESAGTVFVAAMCRWEDFAVEDLPLVFRLWHTAMHEHIDEVPNVDDAGFGGLQPERVADLDASAIVEAMKSRIRREVHANEDEALHCCDIEDL